MYMTTSMYYKRFICFIALFIFLLYLAMQFQNIISNKFHCKRDCHSQPFIAC